MFISDNKRQDWVTSPYVYLEKVEYVSHGGDIQLNFVCRFDKEMPAGMMRVANKSII
jgi:hypothetical protein